jgi:hypothetical protein
VAGAAALLASLLALSGCGGNDVHVDRFDVSVAGHAACPRLLDALPDEVAGQHRRTVSGSTYAAAWGDPAIVLRCGGPLPRTFKGDPCITRNGIGWSVPLRQADDITLDAQMTLAFRTPVLQVHVPAHYRPNGPSEVMADLDQLVRTHTTSTGKHCQ